MLGDKEIYGTYKVTLDDKNRMIIPAAVGVEENEQILVIAKRGNKYLVSQHVFEEYLEDIKRRIHEPKSVDDLNALIDLYDDLCASVVKQTRVDKQHRILLTDIYQPKDKGELLGEGKVLKLIDK